MPKPSTQPLVSVLIPAWNYECYLPETLESLQAQTYDNLELLVLDNGASGASSALCAAYQKHDKRVQIYRTAPCWVPHAYNQLLKVARGDLLAFVSADDVYAPSKIAQQVAVFAEHAAVGAAFSFCSYIDAASQPTLGFGKAFNEAFTRLELIRRLATYCVVCMPTSMVRRSLVAQVGLFDQTLKFTCDYDYWLRAIVHTEFHVIPEQLLQYRVHVQSGTHLEPFRMYRETHRLVARHAPKVFARHPQAKLPPGVLCDKLAEQALGCQDWLPAAQYLLNKSREVALSRQDALCLAYCLLELGKSQAAKVVLRQAMHGAVAAPALQA